MNNETKNYASPFYGKGCITKGNKIYSRWFMLLCVFFFIPALCGLPFIAQMISSGEGFYLLIFLGAFISSLYININVMSQIAYETDVLLQHYCSLSVSTDFEENSGSIIANHIRSLRKIFNRSGGRPVSQDSLIEILHAKLKG